MNATMQWMQIWAKFKKGTRCSYEPMDEWKWITFYFLLAFFLFSFSCTTLVELMQIKYQDARYRHKDGHMDCNAVMKRSRLLFCIHEASDGERGRRSRLLHSLGVLTTHTLDVPDAAVRERETGWEPLLRTQGGHKTGQLFTNRDSSLRPITLREDVVQDIGDDLSLSLAYLRTSLRNRTLDYGKLLGTNRVSLGLNDPQGL